VSTSIGKLRARPKESATFLYTTVFLGATLSDQERKRQRRSHWDDAIKRVKEDVEAREREVERRRMGLGCEPGIGIGIGDVEGGEEGRVDRKGTAYSKSPENAERPKSYSRLTGLKAKKLGEEEEHGKGHVSKRELNGTYSRVWRNEAIERAREELENEFRNLESTVPRDEDAHGQEISEDIHYQDEPESQEDAEAPGLWNNEKFIHQVVEKLPGQPPKHRSFHARNAQPEDVIRYSLDPGGERPPWTPHTALDPTNPSDMPPQSLWSSDMQREKAVKTLWTSKKLTMSEVAVTKGVVKMFILANLSGLPPSQLMYIPEGVRDLARLPLSEQQSLVQDLDYEIDLVKKSEAWERKQRPYLGIPLPNYDQSEDLSHVEIVRDLNESILSLIQAFKNGDIRAKDLIAKMCNNLMVSPAPPEIHTTNIILIAFRSLHRRLNFRRSEEEGIVDIWIEVMRTAAIRPNELTCASILSWYRKRGLPNEFALFVARMRGHRGSLMLARPEVKITEASQGRLIRHPTNPLKVWQAVSPSTMVYWELIKGVLKFSGVAQAVAICRNFGEAAWGMDWDCLFELLLGCFRAKDWENGMVVWEQVEAFGTISRAPKRIQSAMLALCVACGQREKFDELLRSMITGDEKSMPTFVERALQLMSSDSRVTSKEKYGGYIRVDPESKKNVPWSKDIPGRVLLFSELETEKDLKGMAKDRELGEMSSWEKVDVEMNEADWTEKTEAEDANRPEQDGDEFWDRDQRGILEASGKSLPEILSDGQSHGSEFWESPMSEAADMHNEAEALVHEQTRDDTSPQKITPLDRSSPVHPGSEDEPRNSRYQSPGEEFFLPIRPR
jgi:hypothetical protein